MRGLAANYAGDRAIETDAAVLFVDGFESGKLDHWDEDQSAGDESRVSVTDNKADVFFGQHACQMTATRGQNNGGGLIKWLPEGQDEIFARFYVKFADDAGYVHHFVHINGEAKRWGSFGQAGKQPKGDDFFTTGIEPWFDWGKNPPPGKWNFYTYWQEMRAAPDGNYWGNSFPAEGGDIPRGEWICMEVRVKLNTPGKHDGEQTLWRDGEQIAHVTGLNWRSTEKLKANVFWLMSYVTERAFGHTEQHAVKHTDTANLQSHTVWFDQVVVATKYIGPLEKADHK
ncbi:MAG: polysaccharide lyase [Pirellulales bacterium]|nr:polysaccharide lyase [Pirellulales bacterium]